MLELLHQNTNIFLRWAQSELVGLAEIARCFSFNKSSVLARKEEPVDYFGLVVSGLAVAIHDDCIIADLPCLEMIGYMALLNLATFAGAGLGLVSVIRLVLGAHQ